MIKIINPVAFLFIMFFFYLSTLDAQRSAMYDGPYIQIIQDSIIIKWVEEGIPHDTTILKSEASVFNRPNLPSVDLKKLDFVSDDDFEFNHIEKFAFVTDPHGQYDKLIHVLKAHKIIDSLNNWIFEDHHLVLGGDYFSRGDKVIEILWFLFALEKQALVQGGKLHMILGNHDLMTMNNDLRYLNKKYTFTSGAFQKQYYDFFAPNTILGSWLRSKKIMLSINDFLIVHAGISPELVKKSFDAASVNSIFRDSILSFSFENQKNSPAIDFLMESEGPLWYRGFIDTTLDLSLSIDTILNHFNANNIIVGHSIVKEITPKYDQKVLMCDIGFITENPGEILCYENEQFYRGLSDGKKIKLNKKPKKPRKTIFEKIYSKSKTSRPKIIITTDIKKLVSQRMKEEYFPAQFQYYIGDDSLYMEGKVRSRGNMRKQVCYFPPLKFDFNKKSLAKNNLHNSDKLKMVLPCRSGSDNQEKLLVEYFVYGLYRLVDSSGIEASLVNIEFKNREPKSEYDMIGVLVEDPDAFAIRNNARLPSPTSNVMSGALDRDHFVKMYFFQYMIGNTDWAIRNHHNVLLAMLPNDKRIKAFPYDFDYSGIVNQSYAVPHESVPISSVRERYFMNLIVTEEEGLNAINYFKTLKDPILAYCDKVDYLKEDTKKDIKKYLTAFFYELENPKNLIKQLKTK